MFELKHLTAAGVPAALEKAEQYRRLNQPWAAESICCDIVAVDPGNQRALRNLLLARTDLFNSDEGALRRARETLSELASDYERAYYAGIIWERLAKSRLDTRVPRAWFMARKEFRQAMTCYEQAEAIRPPGDDDAILRWNTCARLLNDAPAMFSHEDEPEEPMLDD